MITATLATRKSPARWLRLYLLVAVLALTVGVSAARANTYEVYSCDPNHAGGGTPGWSGVYSEGFWFSGYCGGAQPDGLVTKSVAYPGATSSAFDGAFLWFDAPSGTTIDSIHADFWLTRPGCNWGVGIKATSGDLTGHWVYALQPGYCGTNDIGWARWDWPIHDRRVVQLAVCGAATCDRGSEAFAKMRSVRFTIDDPTPPSLTSPRGGLWESSSWMRGIQTIEFDASDGAGIRRSDVQVDDQTVVLRDHSCDDTQPAPCPNGGATADINTASIQPDGPHTLRLETVDTAGNVTYLTKTIQVDNTPPPVADGVAVDGTDGWRTSNTFTITWPALPADGGAPITAADYRLCLAGSSECVTGARTGEGITSITDLQVPHPGDWTMTMALRDGAGNENGQVGSSPVHLRFDDEAPSVAFDAPNPTDPTLVTATATDAVSSVVDGRIEIRKHGTDDWRALSSSYDGAHISARLDDEQLPGGQYDLRAWAVDAAGNERTSTETNDGAAATVRLPLRVVTRIKAGIASKAARHHSLTHRGSVRLRWGHPIRLGGRLLARDGNPISGAEILVYSRDRRPGAPWTAVASLKTSRRGLFAFRAPPGASRTVRFRFPGTATVRPSVERIVLLVPAKGTIHAADHSLLNGEYLQLRGRVLGGSIPTIGKLVEFQWYGRGHWRAFGNPVHTDGQGRWHFQYRFDGTHGAVTFRLRALLPAEASYPYITGHSRSITIHVRGL